MKSTGAKLIVRTLEKLGVRFTFGIPGVHNTELYDALNESPYICPILVTHEMGAAFMADGMSRTSDSLGTLVIVPAAGATHAMSGIGEAYLGGIPMLILSGGIRTDTGKSFQLHDLDQLNLLEPVTKAAFRITEHNQIESTLQLAARIARSGTPGPVFVEVPVNIQLFKGDVNPSALASQCRLKPAALQTYNQFAALITGSEATDYGDNASGEASSEWQISSETISSAATMLLSAKKPGLFLGWGARNATKQSIRISELLGAPVATTLQGKSVFPAHYPAYTGMGAGNYSVPAAEMAFQDCDCMLAVGLRFAEIPTGSFGMNVPANLIHVDIAPEVFNRNYPAAIVIEGDAKRTLECLADEIERRISGRRQEPFVRIQEARAQYFEDWLNTRMKYVNPARLFQSLRQVMDPTDILVADDGNHTFLAAELFDCYESGTFISPTDFNSMGYSVPASIGAALANQDRLVVSIVGDGAFLMTGLESITAVSYGIGVLILVFHDGELSQISQGQTIPYNRKTCTVLGDFDVASLARSVGAGSFKIHDDSQVDPVLQDAAVRCRNGEVIIVDVRIDYSRKTRFTQGIVKTNLSRFPFSEKMRFLGRALARRVVAT